MSLARAGPATYQVGERCAHFTGNYSRDGEMTGVSSLTQGPSSLAEAESLKARLVLQPNDPPGWFRLAQLLRVLGDAAGALAAVTRALAGGPGQLDSLLLAAALHEDLGDLPTAAAAYRTALSQVRQGMAILQQQRADLEHGKAVIARSDEALESQLETRLSKIRAAFPDEPLGRFDRCMATVLRKRRVYRPMPSFLYFPNIPSVEFFEREDFAWLPQIEAATEDIRTELLGVLASAPEEVRPYITTRETPGVTVQKPAGDGPWRQLEESPRWSSFFLWQEGLPYADNIARCPKTAAAIAARPFCDLPRTAPTVMFSILQPKTRIPPHTGVTNARLVVHLPLIVPPGCGFRVGAETRQWELGKALIFDDSIEHEAWNDSDQMRAVLIFDIWNPFLTRAEREMVKTLSAGIGDYYGTLPPYV